MNELKAKKTIYNVVGIISFFVLIILDQITKYAAVLKLKNQESFVLVKDVFELHYLENRGAAFGILQGQKAIFVVITVIILAVIVYVYLKMPVRKRFHFLRVLLVLIAAGAVGNFIDRIRQSYVVDFFYFKAINFPIFNVADIYVTCAAIILVLAILFYYKDDDLKELGAAIKPAKNRE